MLEVFNNLVIAIVFGFKLLSLPLLGLPLAGQFRVEHLQKCALGLNDALACKTVAGLGVQQV